MATRFHIFAGSVEIGTSLLEERDPDMGTASGPFVPGASYESVRSVFRLFSDAQSETGPHDSSMVARYYEERDKLALRIETSEGVTVPTSVVHISDFAEGPDDDSYEVEVHVDDSAFFGS